MTLAIQIAFWYAAYATRDRLTRIAIGCMMSG